MINILHKQITAIFTPQQQYKDCTSDCNIKKEKSKVTNLPLFLGVTGVKALPVLGSAVTAIPGDAGELSSEYSLGDDA